MSVIRYISNETTRFHAFVANRVSEIRDVTNVSQWRYIESMHNPADMASKGANIDQLMQGALWLHGPAFLSTHITEWHEQPGELAVLHEKDPEVRKISNTAVVTQHHVEHNVVDQLLLICSTWFTLKRVWDGYLRS